MNPETERKRDFIISTAYAALVVAIYYVFFKYVIYAIMPFFLAAVITLLLKRPVDWFSRITKIPRKGVGALFLLLFYGVIVVGVVLIILRLVGLASGLLADMPAIYEETIMPAVSKVLDTYEDVLSKISPNILGYLEAVSNSILSKLAEFAAWLSRNVVTLGKNIVVALPSILIGAVFSIVATAIMTLDTPRIEHFLLGQFSDKNKAIIQDARHYLGHGITDIIRSYGIIMVITFFELCLGFFIIKQSNIIALSAIIALFDILPALGVGTILIPWALIDFLNGSYKHGIELLIIYAAITVIRNIIEPKIVGDSVGVHAVVILMSMYVGTKVFGALGIIILPFTVIVIKNLNDTGRIEVFRSDYLDEAKKNRKQVKQEKKAQKKEKKNG